VTSAPVSLRVEHTPPSAGLRYVARRAWRVIASGVSFTCFGLGGGLFGLLAPPVLFLCWRDPARRQVQARRAIGVLMRVFVWLMRTLGLIDVRVEGLAWLHARGAVIAPNHPTLIDVVLLLALAPQLDCVIKGALLRNPFTRGAVRAAGYIANTDGPALVARCAAVLREGNSVLVFPEGTRSVPGERPHLTRGACSIVLTGDGCIVPVLIRCAPPALSKQHRWYDLPAGPLQIDIDVHAPWSASSCLRAVAGHDGGPSLAPGATEATRLRVRATREMTRALEAFYAEGLGFVRSVEAPARSDGS
jgi:1-acyl-sn-glycerol-3-phosphate acyltransferase